MRHPVTAMIVFALSYAFPAETGSDDSTPATLADSIVADALTYQGTPYVEGGNGPAGFDCSGLVCRVFGDHGVDLPRTVTAMEELGVEVAREDLQPGDLMIFHDPRHVGIYIGNGEFIHCSSWRNRGVVITPIDHSNYLRRYHTSRRVL